MEQCSSFEECQRRFTAMERALNDRVREQDWQKDISAIEREIINLKSDIKDLTLTSNDHNESLLKLETAIGFLEEKMESLKQDFKENVDDLKKTVKEDIKEIKDQISKAYWWLIGIMGTVIATLLVNVIINFYKAKP